MKNILKNTLPIPGVVRILKHLGKPAIKKLYEIENLRILIEDTDEITFLIASKLNKDDSLIVDKGIFDGLIADCII